MQRLTFSGMALTLALAPGAAFAQGAPPALPPGMGGEDVAEREGTAKPFAEDHRSGHLFIRATGAVGVPVGWISPVGSLEDLSAVAGVFGGSIGVGVSRHTELDVVGGFGLLGPSFDCLTCKGDFGVATLGLRYHLLDGAALDPWIRLGMGYRTTAIAYESSEIRSILDVAEGRYHGFDFADIALGGTFFPTPGFGLGPFVGVNLGTNLVAPNGAKDDPLPYVFFDFGLAFEIDPVSIAHGSYTTSASSEGPSHF